MTFTTGDTAPAFTATLTNGTAPANLSGANVLLHLSSPSGRVLTVVAQVASPVDGEVAYQWLVGDLVEPGQWHWEAEVTYSDASIQTFPGSLPFSVGGQIA